MACFSSYHLYFDHYHKASRNEEENHASLNVEFIWLFNDWTVFQHLQWAVSFTIEITREDFNIKWEVGQECFHRTDDLAAYNTEPVFALNKNESQKVMKSREQGVLALFGKCPEER